MSEHYSEIGLLLSQARRQQRWSINEASQALHIRPRYLEALEQGHLEELPGIPYAKGYLQAYATFLELDRDEILRRFEQVEETLGRQGFYLPTVLRREKAPKPQFIWGALSAALLVYAIWWGSHKTSHSTLLGMEAWPIQSPQDALKEEEASCFQPENTVYPPCYVREPEFDLLPVSSQKKTIMELAHLFNDDAEQSPEETLP